MCEAERDRASSQIPFSFEHHTAHSVSCLLSSAILPFQVRTCPDSSPLVPCHEERQVDVVRLIDDLRRIGS